MKTENENNRPMMKCGHAANAETPDGKPVCVICAGINPGAYEVDENPPNLEGREAKCGYCNNKRPSSPNLPFFEHHPNREFDEYYCGCFGWD